MSVLFLPEQHQYVSIDPTESITWKSVTSVVSDYKEHFDAPAIALKCSKNKKSKWFGMSPEDIQKAWKAEADRATTLGTWYHNQRESDLLECNTIDREGVKLNVIKPIEVDGVKQAPLQKLEEGIYPEHFVFLKSAGICGQSDRVEVYNGKVYINDYKTNKEIKLESFTNWEGVSKMMLPPVNHLPDCNFWHYALQLSFYMYIILKHNHKLKPGKLMIDHVIFEDKGLDEKGNKIHVLDENGKPKIKDIVHYELPYLKSEVIAIINEMKNKK